MPKGLTRSQLQRSIEQRKAAASGEAPDVPGQSKDSDRPADAKVSITVTKPSAFVRADSGAVRFACPVSVAAMRNGPQGHYQMAKDI